MMTNLAHWQDDIDDALGGDFDGSLSGLCIMSLSFDFTRNGLSSGPHLSQNKDHTSSGSRVGPSTGCEQAASLPKSLVTTSSSKQTSTSGNQNMNRETHSESNSLNAFKRFKSSLASEDKTFDFNRGPNYSIEEVNDHNDDNGDENKSCNQSKIVRHLQQIRDCLSSASLSTKPTAHGSNALTDADCNLKIRDSNQERFSQTPTPAEEDSCQSTISTPGDSSRHSSDDEEDNADAKSSSSSSISNRTAATSNRSTPSPSDMSMHCPNEINGQSGNNNSDPSRNNNNNAISTSRSLSLLNDQPARALYSVKEGLLNGGGTLKESSYTTSVITTTAPMHFKSIHHPFSLKQFPPSPYHQFSNSSFNHDFYDRYLSHDSHQPLQTPLIGIERTQDLLSLKLPPHGPDETDSQRFTKDWMFEENHNKTETTNKTIETGHSSSNQRQIKDHVENNQPMNRSVTNQNESSTNPVKRKLNETGRGDEDSSRLKSFRFSYTSNSSANDDNGNTNDIERDRDTIKHQNEPIDLNVSYGHHNECCENDDKEDMFNQSMKHFNPERMQQDCCRSSLGQDDNEGCNENSPNQSRDNASRNDNCSNIYHPQDSLFGLEHPSKQRFQYVLAAPISVATKLNEDTMTYLNQGQAYEIKLENITDVSEAKKGFMCSIINIGFHERHMQQAENELWQQWSQQHPIEKIFSVDMKLSYNVFGVESDGLNKYEFLWDSSKAAGVFIRINSISTEFTPKKHGGEKGVPFKLSIETFSYNSKTHDSYFISAACCQIKVFKPKGAERKIRSDRDKVSKKPSTEQDKYHRPCDHTLFRECSLSSLHPSADDSLCYYRHSHGHFASKQGTTSVSVTPAAQVTPQHQAGSHQSISNDVELANNCSHNNQATSEAPSADKTSNNPTDNSYCRVSHMDNVDQQQQNNFQSNTSYPSSYHNNHNNESPSYNQVYQNNQARSNSQHFNLAYYNHPTIPPPPPPPPPPLPLPSHNPQDIPTSHGNYSMTNPYGSSTSFRASDLAISSHNNFTEAHDLKGNVATYHDNFESSSSVQHTVHPTNQFYRQRSASTSSANPPNAHCANYMLSHGVHHNNHPQAVIEHAPNSGAWTNENQSSASSCASRGSTNGSTQNPETNPYSATSAIINRVHQYDSDQQSSPQKSQNTNDSPLSCYSRFKRVPTYNVLAGVQQQSEQLESRPYNQFNCSSHSITVNSTCVEVASWLLANRFGLFSKTFNNFSGSDLLRLSKTELTEICGLLDGIRLHNCLHNQPIKPKRALYICVEGSEIFHPVYLYDVTLRELLREISSISKQQSENLKQELTINRLLIEGLTTVKIVATEQVIQMLEDESVWTLSISREEACISAHRPDRAPK